MANNKSAIKRIKTAERNQLRNTSAESKIKTYIYKTINAINNKDKELETTLKETIKVIDSTARKGIIHKNKANRIKSRLTLKANKLED
jgi:small subunit ribosomal protein S20